MEEENQFRILALTGHQGSGKTTISNKLVRDQKYHRIIVTEQDRKTLSVQDLVSSLIKKTKESDTNKVLLEGFPINKKQAILFETQFVQFQLLILFQCSHQILLTRRMSKQKDQNPEFIKSVIDNAQVYLNELSDFYSNFGLLYKVKNQDDPDEVYENVKKILLPKIIFLYGPPKNGKSQLALKLENKMGYHYISLRDFYFSRQGKPKLQVVNQFISHLKRLTHKSFIIDDLLETRDEFMIFQKEMGFPQKIYYLDSHKDEVEIAISTKCQPQDKQKNRKKYLRFVENRQKLLQLIKEQPFFKKIRGNQSILQIEKQIIQDIKPTVVTAFYNTEEEGNFLKQFQTKAGWKIIDIEVMKNNHADRKTDIGKKVINSKTNNKILPIKVIIDILRNCIFGKEYKKIIVLNLGDKMSLYESIEHELFQLGLLEIEFEKKAQFKPQDHPLLHYFEHGKLYKIRQKRTQLLDAMLQSSIKYGLLFGPTSSGKTTIVKNLSKQYGMIEIQWQPTIQKVKEFYLTQEEKAEDQVPTYKILKYLKDTFMNNLDKTFILDGLHSDKMLPEIKKHLGNPSFILNKRISKQGLTRRIRIKQQADLTAEITEEEAQKIDQALKQGQRYVKWSQQLSEADANVKTFSLDSEGTVQNTLQSASPLFQRRVYIVYNQIQQTNTIIKQALINLFKNIAYNNDILYINVDKLVEQAIENSHSEIGQLLRNQYQLRASEQLNKMSAQIYSPSLIIKLIKKHIDSTNQEYKDYMLVDYPRPKRQGQSKFPLISDQLATIENHLGNIKVVVTVSKNDVDSSINDPQLELERPQAPEVVVKQGQEPPVQQKPNDEQPQKKTFNIFDYEWSSSYTAKTIAQWYCNLKPYTDKIKIPMSAYDAINLYDQFPKYVDDVKKNKDSYYFLEVKRQF